MTKLNRVLLVVGVWLFLVVLALVAVVPNVPRSIGGWVAFLVLAPPLYVGGEWLGGKLSEGWGERSAVAKLAKAVLFVIGGLALIVAWVIFKAM